MQQRIQTYQRFSRNKARGHKTLKENFQGLHPRPPETYS